MVWKMLLSAAAAWLVAQLLKFLIDGVRSKKFNPKMFLLPGKMPSSHTSTVVALTTAVYLVDGFSGLFAVALVFSVIVVYDTVTSRRQVGIITQALNGSMKKKIRYFEGHTPLQALVGAILGFVIACLIYII